MGVGHGVGGLTGGMVYSAAGVCVRASLRKVCVPAVGLQAVFLVASVVTAGSWGVIGAVHAWRGRRRGWTAVPTVDVDDGW